MNLTDQHKIRIGTCAWTFEDWHGSFYPSDLPESQWLQFYANYFPSVEVDSTFYGAPAEATIRRWIEITPATFRFTCKLPREITHTCRLRDCTAELNLFLQTVEPLAPKLHVILIQLPPSFAPKDGKAALRKFLQQLPRDFRFAIEFRNAGWHRPQIIRLLEKHRVCWVWADTTPINERNLAPFEFLPCTTDFLYLRSTYIVMKSCCGNAKLPSIVGRSRLSGIFLECAVSGHLQATTSKDLHPKLAGDWCNVWALICRCRSGANGHFQNQSDRSLTCNCRRRRAYFGPLTTRAVRLCFSKTQTSQIPKIDIFSASREKLSPNCACECASEAVVNGMPFFTASSMIRSPG